MPVFTGRMPFLPPNQQRQSTEGRHYTTIRNVVQCGYAWSLNEGWYLWTTTVHATNQNLAPRQTCVSSWLSMSPWHPPNTMTSPSLTAVAVCHSRGGSSVTPRSYHCSDSVSNSHRSAATTDTHPFNGPLF